MKDEKGILLLRLKNHKEGVSIIKKGARWQDSQALVAFYQARQADLPEGATILVPGWIGPVPGRNHYRRCY